MFIIKLNSVELLESQESLRTWLKSLCRTAEKERMLKVTSQKSYDSCKAVKGSLVVAGGGF